MKLWQQPAQKIEKRLLSEWDLLKKQPVFIHYDFRGPFWDSTAIQKKEHCRFFIIQIHWDFDNVHAFLFALYIVLLFWDICLNRQDTYSNFPFSSEDALTVYVS